MTETPEGCLNVQKLYNANTGFVVDRPLLNTKWMLPNHTIVLITCGLLSAQIASRCGTFTPV